MKGEFIRRLRAHERPVVVDLRAPWCGSCRALAPALARVAESYAGRVDRWQVDVGAEPGPARQLGARVIPTLVAYHSGREVARVVGNQPRVELERLFEQALAGVASRRRGPSTVDRSLRAAAGAVALLLAIHTSSPVLYGASLAAFTAAFCDRLWFIRSRRSK